MMIKLYSLVALIAVLATLTQSIETDHAKLIVVKQPSYHLYDYSSKTPLKLSDLSDFLLATNGFTIDKTIEWKGLKTTNPLSVPKATLLFLVNSQSFNDSFATQFITVDENTSFDVEALRTRLGSNVVTKSFDSVSSDMKNLEDDCSVAMSTVFYVFRVPDSESQDLENSVNKIIEKFNQFCVVDQKNDLLAYVLATNPKHVVKREAIQSNNRIILSNNILNRAVFYSDQYPAMFNLLFWTTLLIALAVLGIAYGMFQMDPGLDTVIYRMTSQRIKKDQ